jgi:hypothetical protein
MRRTDVIRPLSLLAGLVLLAVGCGSVAPTTTTAPNETASAIGDDPAAVDIGPLLDPGSRDLLAAIDPAESILASLTVQAPEPVAAAARSRALTVQVVANDILVVEGPVKPVLEFVADVHPLSVGIGEDPSVDRWLPAERPVVQVPVPGRPYLTQPMVADLSRVVMPEERRLPMLRSFAEAIQTIDGRPYARLDVSGDCDPEEMGPVCTIYSAAFVVGAGSRSDDRSARGDAASGWRVVFVDGTVFLWSVPRTLLRAVEWTARHDPAAAKALGAYDTCCGARWDPLRPGRIGLYYSRPCAEGAASPDREVAATGDCFEGLTITVDVRDGTVVSIDRAFGPGGA